MSAGRRRVPFLAFLVAILSVFGLLVSAAGAAIPVGPQADEEPKSGGEWTVGILEEPDTLDPHKTAARITNDIMRSVCDPLIAKDFEGSFVPGLATEWTISEDGLTWTFSLREDVTFHDGTKFNAAAVKFSFDRILDPATKSAAAVALLGPAASTTVIDEYTFEYKLKEPFAPLLDDLANQGLICIVSPDAVAAAGDDFGRKPVSTGPFMVEEWRSGDRIILKRNPDYAWAPDFLHQGSPAYLETLVFRSIIEEAARTAAFEAGEIDQLRNAPAAEVARLKESDDYWIVEYQNQGLQLLEFNVTKAPFDDVTVRRAMNFAIDKEAVIEGAIEGLGMPAYGFLPPSIWGYWEGIEDYAPGYDPEQAKALLAEAGWTDSDGDGTLDKDGQPFKFTAMATPIEFVTRAAQIVQSQLKEIGVEMEVQTFEFGTLLEKLKAGEQQADFIGYTYHEPDIAYLWFHSTNIGTGINLPHINDPTLDELTVKGRSTTDLEARAKVYEDLQKYVVDIAVWVPLWVPTVVDAFHQRIHGANFHPNGYTVYTDAWVE